MSEVVVSAGTYRALEDIARRLDCTVNAALEEVLREFDPRAASRSDAPDVETEAS